MEDNTRENTDASKAKKRRHLNSDTPSPLMQREASTSSQKQIKLFQDENFSIKMAVIHKDYPDAFLDQEFITFIKNQILDAICAINTKNSENSEHPQFHSFDFEEGPLIVTCANENTKNWLIRTVANFKLLNEFGITVVDSKTLPKESSKPNMYRLTVCIPENLSVEQIKSRLRIQNPKLNINMWNIRNMSIFEKTWIYCAVDYDSFSFLEKNNFEAYWMLGKITFQENESEIKNLKKQRKIIHFINFHYFVTKPKS